LGLRSFEKDCFAFVRPFSWVGFCLFRWPLEQGKSHISSSFDFSRELKVPGIR